MGWASRGEQVLATARQLYHIEQVRSAGNDGARDLAVAATNPGPLARGVERLAHRGAQGLGRAVQPWSIMRQGRSIPKEVARDVGPRSGGGQPVHAIAMQG